MDQKRLLELAIEALEGQKAAVDAEIEAIHAELKGAGAPQAIRPVSVAGRGHRNSAARRAQSERMRKIWATRKAAAAKKATQEKAKPERAAVNKAISLAMKAAWVRRRAKAAGKAVKTGPASAKVSSKTSSKKIPTIMAVCS
jgi:hypothetical protein